jgi:hypothetical protein
VLAPWTVRLDKASGYPFESAKHVQIANPVSFLTQKVLIQKERDRKDRAKDTLYMHDTIEMFSGNLPELRELFAHHIRPKLHAKKADEVRNAANALFGGLNDTIRESVRMAIGRDLASESLMERCRAGLRAIFE